MKYILGLEKDFHDFVDLISKEDKIGIVTHTDLDGLASGLFLQKILESKGLKIEFIEFLQYGIGVLKSFLERDFDILFLTDWKADEYEKDLNALRKKGKVFVVDHHPLNEKLKDKSGIIKTDSGYCSSHTLFDLAKSGNYFNTREWEWLVCSAIIMDYTFIDERVFGFLKLVYPEIKNKEKIFDSEPGLIGKKIDNAVIYYKPNIKKVYDLVLKKDLDSLNKVNVLIEKEIKKTEKKYMKEAEYFPEKNLYFYYFNPKYSFTSSVISEISYENPDKTFILVSDKSDNSGFVKLSARNQTGKIDLDNLLKKCVEGFKDSTAGGHVKAAAGSFPKKYLGEFKDRLLKNL